MSEREDEGPALRTGRANHRRGGIADGGRLTLTAGVLRGAWIADITAHRST